jgi:predicted phage-related endonuclease
MEIRHTDLITVRHSTKPDRRSFIGGSDARIIMSPDERALIRLWREKRGEVESEDLSGNLIVQLGVATETLNRAWYERNTGRVVSDVQRWVRHPVHRYLAATLDGFVNDLNVNRRPNLTPDRRPNLTPVGDRARTATLAPA